MSIWNVINLAGGLAMFIFGMNLMSDGLKLVAGSYLKKILEKLTKNRIIAMMVGAGLTALIQSSNAMCCLLYTSPSPRDRQKSRMPSSA